MKDIHPPLPERTIDWWLRQQLRKARHDRIAAYAAEIAGTNLDLDPDLESAGIEHLVVDTRTAPMSPTPGPRSPAPDPRFRH